MPEPQDYVDVQIQFRPAKDGAQDDVRSTHEVFATVNGGGGWRGETTIDLAALGALENDPDAYGQRLGEWLLPPQLIGALAQARGLKERPVRLRLLLELGRNCERGIQHRLRWERACVPINGQLQRLAITIPFSRYIPAESIDPDISDDTALRVLLVFANPSNLPAGLNPVSVGNDLSKLLDGLEPLVQTKQFKLSVIHGATAPDDALRARLDALGAEVIPGAARKELIAEVVQRCQGLHIVAHGVFNAETRQGSLLLEDEHGGRAFAFDNQLQSWIHPGLRFVVLQSCQTGAVSPKGGPPFVGIGPTLVSAGVPAVVAMQDFMPMDDARVFAATFYRSLLHGGVVDAAVNDARKAIYRKPQDDSYSIPVLFMRLRNGLLWRPDPVRRAVNAQLAALGKARTHELPMRAILSLQNTLAYEAETGPPGAVFNMPQKLVDLCAPPQACVVLAGSRGMAKTAQIRWLYRRAAERYLDDATAPAPILMTARQIVDAGDVDKAINRTLGLDKDEGTPVWSERELLLVVDGDEEIGEERLRYVLARLREFLQTPARRLAFSLDDRARKDWTRDFAPVPTAVLVTQPMDFNRVLHFLKSIGTDKAKSLRDFIEQRQCRDIAGTPWLLERMISLNERGETFTSRATLLTQIAGECLASVPANGIPRQCAERALEQIAWRIQSTRDATLGGSQLFTILADVRAQREFNLVGLRDMLVDSDILAVAGDDGVRFRYQSLQAYYTAGYLMRVMPAERRRILEDITASLGRLARARWWEKTLITLCGLDARNRKDILGAILAGSALADGEQVYLAARCYTDTGNGDARLKDVVDQVADSLIWRSHPGNLRPYADRRRAALALAELRHPNAVPHFVSLATEKLAPGWSGEKRFEYSGIRLIATNGLVLMRDEATEYVRKSRSKLGPALASWQKAYEDSELEPLVRELKANEPATSPIAAFALGLTGNPDAQPLLIEAFSNPETNREVGWAVADTLANMDPEWVARDVLAPRLTEFKDPRVAYLVGRVALAGESSGHYAYLESCLQHGTPAVQARALRALGDLQHNADRVRAICEAIVANDWDEAQRQGLALSRRPKGEDASRFQNVSTEALRSIGTDKSIDVLRRARQRPDMSVTLRQLSFDVTEDIYWRISGGLVKESVNLDGHDAQA